MTVLPFKSKDDLCVFCGNSPDHRGFWACPRLKSVSMDTDGWSVEFVPDYFDVDFEPDTELGDGAEAPER